MSKTKPKLDQPIVYIDKRTHRGCSDEGVNEPIRRYKTVRVTANYTDYELDDPSSAEIVIERINNGRSGYYGERPRVFTSLKAAWAERIEHLEERVANEIRGVESARKELAKSMKDVPIAKARLAKAKKLAAKAEAAR